MLTVLFVCQDVTTRPKLILNTPLVKLWYKKDDTFWVPKAHVWFMLKRYRFRL